MDALDSFLDRAWSEHADRPAAVAARLEEAIVLVQDDAGVARLAALGHHVLGEHLARWADGLAFLTALAARGAHAADGAAALARCRASLALCGGLGDGRARLSDSDACRVTAMAAGNLCAVDAARAAALLEDAVARAEPIADADPAVRVVAANANNIAATLHDLTAPAPPQRELMIRAAQIARTHWQRAGTWREVERAEYRLALSWLVAGDPARARQHAEDCAAIVGENGNEPLELFFAAEVLARAAQALGDERAHADALATAQSAFAALAAADQAWCRATLDKIAPA